MQTLRWMTECIMCLPLFGGVVAGLLGKVMGRTTTHRLTIALVGLAALMSAYVLVQVVRFDLHDHWIWYHWLNAGMMHAHVGFLLDPLAGMMLLTVTGISTLVHIYSIGYMHDEDGYQRFFAYMSLFTFAMLALVLADNFFQLFFGWEGVGVVSYLLIGFWFTKPSAASGSMKAFLVNRVGDFGFLLGIALVLVSTHSLDYQASFNHVADFLAQSLWGHRILDWACLLLFVGAMGKSAQIPLHVWLPESMEGPTPISALIHAATMVTAGVYMVARLSPCSVCHRWR